MVTLVWIAIIALVFLWIYFPKRKTLHQLEMKEKYQKIFGNKREINEADLHDEKMFFVSIPKELDPESVETLGRILIEVIKKTGKINPEDYIYKNLEEMDIRKNRKSDA